MANVPPCEPHRIAEGCRDNFHQTRAGHHRPWSQSPYISVANQPVLALLCKNNSLGLAWSLHLFHRHMTKGQLPFARSKYLFFPERGSNGLRSTSLPDSRGNLCAIFHQFVSPAILVRPIERYCNDSSVSDRRCPRTHPAGYTGRIVFVSCRSTPYASVTSGVQFGASPALVS